MEQQEAPDTSTNVTVCTDRTSYSTGLSRPPRGRGRERQSDPDRIDGNALVLYCSGDAREPRAESRVERESVSLFDNCI